MKNTIHLILGDKRNHTDTVIIKTNFTIKQLKSAYIKGAKKIGFDLSKSICTAFDDTQICFEDYSKLMDAGLIMKEIFKQEKYLIQKIKYEDNLLVDIDSFAKIWLFIAKLGNKNFNYKIQNVKNVINIGGKGLLE